MTIPNFEKRLDQIEQRRLSHWDRIAQRFSPEVIIGQMSEEELDVFIKNLYIMSCSTDPESAAEMLANFPELAQLGAPEWPRDPRDRFIWTSPTGGNYLSEMSAGELAERGLTWPPVDTQ